MIHITYSTHPLFDRGAELVRTLCGKQVVRVNAESPIVQSNVDCIACRRKHLEYCKEEWADEEMRAEQ